MLLRKNPIVWLIVLDCSGGNFATLDFLVNNVNSSWWETYLFRLEMHLQITNGDLSIAMFVNREGKTRIIFSPRSGNLKKKSHEFMNARKILTKLC